MQDRREATASLVQRVKSAVVDAESLPPHVLSPGDIVYLGSKPHPYWVIRIGYGSYLQEVRVRRFDEPDVFSSGQWVHHDSCFLLEVGDKLTAMADMTDATVADRHIPRGCRCVFRGRDSDGDILLNFSPPIEGCSRSVISVEL